MAVRTGGRYTIGCLTRLIIPGEPDLDLIVVATVFSAATNLALAISYIFIWRTLLRRRYVALLALTGVFGMAEVLLGLLVHASEGRGGAAYLAASAAGSLGTIAWVGGCYDFARRRLPVVVLGLSFAALTAWSVVAPAVTTGFFARESADSLIKGALGIWLAITFWRSPRFPARIILSVLFAVQGLHQLDYPFLADKSWGITTGLAISNFLGISVILFLMMTVLEEARSETAVAQESLRRSEALAEMGQLVAGVAHEVRNPLTALSAGLQTLEAAEPELTRRHGDLLGDLRSALTRLTTLTRDLLVYGRPTEPTLAAGDPGEVARRAAVACASLAQQAGVRLDVQADAQLPQVTMDRDRMVQVFVNLITNAVQHSPTGGTVVIACVVRSRRRHRWIEWEVVDSGPGFSQELLAQVFQPFASRRPGGTGLGLAIARRLVHQQGGRIAAANSPGAGALVRVTLPLGAATAAPRSAA